MNFDGVVTAGDSQTVFSIVLGTYVPNFEEWYAADCNNDGDITAGDSQTIFAMVPGMDQYVDELYSALLKE